MSVLYFFFSEDEFVWQDYLEATNSAEVPHTLFIHVSIIYVNV